MQLIENLGENNHKVKLIHKNSEFSGSKTLSLSLTPDLLQLIKEMSYDKKALNHTMMHRTTMHHTSASCKLKFVVAKTAKENMVQDLREKKFSLNIDEAMSNNNEKVITILVNYLTNDKTVTEHLRSFQ